MFWPFTVWGFLKSIFKPHEYWLSRTRCCNSTYRLRYWNFPSSCDSNCTCYIVAIVLTVYGIETIKHHKQYDNQLHVAIVLTVYGIETQFRNCFIFDYSMLQQCLPFTVLKRFNHFHIWWDIIESCNSAYRLRYWNHKMLLMVRLEDIFRCNSTYRLRYLTEYYDQNPE